jgi:hypothetical protein
MRLRAKAMHLHYLHVANRRASLMELASVRAPFAFDLSCHHVLPATSRVCQPTVVLKQMTPQQLYKAPMNPQLTRSVEMFDRYS